MRQSPKIYILVLSLFIPAPAVQAQQHAAATVDAASSGNISRGPVRINSNLFGVGIDQLVLPDGIKLPGSDNFQNLTDQALGLPLDQGSLLDVLAGQSGIALGDVDFQNPAKLGAIIAATAANDNSRQVQLGSVHPIAIGGNPSKLADPFKLDRAATFRQNTVNPASLNGLRDVTKLLKGSADPNAVISQAVDGAEIRAGELQAPPRQMTASAFFQPTEFSGTVFAKQDRSLYPTGLNPSAQKGEDPRSPSAEAVRPWESPEYVSDFNTAFGALKDRAIQDAGFNAMTQALLAQTHPDLAAHTLWMEPQQLPQRPRPLKLFTPGDSVQAGAFLLTLRDDSHEMPILIIAAPQKATYSSLEQALRHAAAILAVSAPVHASGISGASAPSMAFRPSLLLRASLRSKPAVPVVAQRLVPMVLGATRLSLGMPPYLDHLFVQIVDEVSRFIHPVRTPADDNRKPLKRAA